MSDSETTITQLKSLVQEFVQDREWTKYHTLKNLAGSISIEAAELMEIFQWAKDSEISSILMDNRSEIEAELADILIYCMSFSNASGIDIAESIRKKIKENERKYPVEKYRGKYKT
jgi:dCTP diphosphatase